MSAPVPRPPADPAPAVPLGTILLAGMLAVVLILIVAVCFEYAKPRQGNIIFPGGTTYLGDRDSGASPTPAAAPQAASPVTLTAPADAAWKTFTGKANPFRFRYPETVAVALYPNAATETVVIRVGEKNPTEYPFLSVIDMTAGAPASYRGKPDAFVAAYDKVSMGLSSVAPAVKFTNTAGLTGYRTTLTLLNGTTQDAVFFAVPGRTDRLIKLINTVLAPDLFTRITDTVGWGA